MRVTIDVDPVIWWHLAGLAEARGKTVPSLIEDSLTVITAASGRTPTRHSTRDTVAALVAQGFTDIQIARRLKCTKQNVYNHRRNLGLAPNYLEARSA